MKKRFVAMVILVVIGAFFLSACALSTVARKSVEMSSQELNKWVEMFKARLEKLPDDDIAPFVIWITTIIGEDKPRLPREGERLVDKIYTMVTSKPDGHKFNKRERAEFMGAWDRLFVILTEETGKKGLEIAQKIVSAGIL